MRLRRAWAKRLFSDNDLRSAFRESLARERSS
jgi:hypothetical protein